MSKENGKPTWDKTMETVKPSKPIPTGKPAKATKAVKAVDQAKAAGEAGVSRDYGKASPEEIMADIERTQIHMDETLDQLGRRIRPRIPGKAVGIALGVLAAGVVGFIGFRVFGSRKSHRTSLRSPRWREARLLEQVNLARKLAMTAGNGKPAIIVVEPRKL